jgi:hypothetical protein
MPIPNQAGNGYSYSQFSYSKDFSLYLTFVDAKNVSIILPLVSFNSNFALNEIPDATCTVGVGRDVSSDNALTYAPIHKYFNLRQLQAAQVYFYPIGQETSLKDWPNKPFLVFDGYITSIRRTKSMGKYQVDISLTHWLFDLACSSAVSGNSHVSNPGDMASAAVFSTGAGSGAYTSGAIQGANSAIFSYIARDFWGVLKSVFSAYAQSETRPLGPPTGCIDGIVNRNNARALQALERIEGPDVTGEKGKTGRTNKDYVFGKPLKFDFADLEPTIKTAIATALNDELVKSYAETSFWTKLVTQFCPLFGMAVVPMIDTAIVIADTPLFKPANSTDIKVIYAEDYESEVTCGAMDRPLAAVVVVASAVAGATGSTTGQNKDIVGCYVNDIADPDGVVLYTGTPPWLNVISTENISNTSRSNTNSNVALREIFNKWAKEVYIKNVLRGRSQTVSGRLRFDIAPGTLVRVSSAAESIVLPEEAYTNEDNLGNDIYGEVVRVSVFINADAPAAGTSFLITNVRTIHEYLGTNPKNVYNVDSPGIYTKESIHGNGKHGAPLNSNFT